MKNIYTNTKFVMVDSDWEHVFPMSISDNVNYPEITNWGGLRPFVKSLDLRYVPVVNDPSECPYNDGECRHCNYCYDEASDECEALIPVYSYVLSWKQNRRLLSAFCDAWGVNDISGVLRFIEYHRKSLNKTCGRGWVDSLIRRVRRAYYSSF